MKEIKNIIFDLGGVLLNIDFKRTFTAFEIIGFRGFRRWSHLQEKTDLDIVYRPSLNEYNGIASIQLELEDWTGK